MEKKCYDGEHKERLRSDLWIVLLDIIAVNGTYLLALLVRFYVHFRFTSGIGDFREYYLQFTPYYTVLSDRYEVKCMRGAKIEVGPIKAA